MLVSTLLALLISCTLVYDKTSLDKTKEVVGELGKAQLETYEVELEEYAKLYSCDACVEGISKKQGGFYDFTFTDPKRPNAQGGLFSAMAEKKYCDCVKGDSARLTALMGDMK